MTRLNASQVELEIISSEYVPFQGEAALGPNGEIRVGDGEQSWDYLPSVLSSPQFNDGFILQSPDSTLYRVTVADDGTLTTTLYIPV